MSDKLEKNKKAEKLYYKGNGITYWFSPEDKKWSLQVKNPALISTLWRYFYKQSYKPLSGAETVVFKFHDHRFEEIAEYIHQNYRPALEIAK